MASSVLSDSDARLALIPRDMCAPFYQEARQIESGLIHFYKMIVVIAKKEMDLNVVSDWWTTMVFICDAFAGKLSALCKAHPTCGAEAFYDRVLDLRNKCQRLQTMHS
jgi:hypothetical protein